MKTKKRITHEIKNTRRKKEDKKTQNMRAEFLGYLLSLDGCQQGLNLTKRSNALCGNAATVP